MQRCLAFVFHLLSLLSRHYAGIQFSRPSALLYSASRIISIRVPRRNHNRYGAVVGGLLVAGGMPEFLGVHFGDVERGMINAVGAVGLIVNAIVTGGEGVASLI